MEIVGMLLIVMGFGLALVGGIWFLVLAFQEDIMWGIGCLLCGIVQLVFLVMHIDQTWKPFAVQMAGLALVVVGAAMQPQPGEM